MRTFYYYLDVENKSCIVCRNKQIAIKNGFNPIKRFNTSQDLVYYTVKNYGGKMVDDLDTRVY